MKNPTKNQHTVPKCYLKSFGENLIVFDRFTKLSVKKNIKDISVIDYFYEHSDFETNEIENLMNSMENDWAFKCRDKLLNNINKQNCKLKNREIWAKFIFIQIFRTQKNIRQSDAVIKCMDCFINKNCAISLKSWWYEFNFRKYLLYKITSIIKPINSKNIHLNIIKDTVKDTEDDYKFLINDYDWVVFKNANSMHKFLTSDNPVLRIPKNNKNCFIVTISPDLCIILTHKNDENINEVKFKTPNYNFIVDINKLYILQSYKEIYLNNDRQEEFVKKILQESTKFDSYTVLINIGNDVYNL